LNVDHFYPLPSSSNPQRDLDSALGSLIKHLINNFSFPDNPTYLATFYRLGDAPHSRVPMPRAYHSSTQTADRLSLSHHVQAPPISPTANDLHLLHLMSFPEFFKVDSSLEYTQVDSLSSSRTSAQPSPLPPSRFTAVPLSGSLDVDTTPSPSLLSPAALDSSVTTPWTPGHQFGAKAKKSYRKTTYTTLPSSSSPSVLSHFTVIPTASLATRMPRSLIVTPPSHPSPPNTPPTVVPALDPQSSREPWHNPKWPHPSPLPPRRKPKPIPRRRYPSTSILSLNDVPPMSHSAPMPIIHLPCAHALLVIVNQNVTLIFLPRS
jgi:hypothetical protein